jgi:hypothetical protein
MGTEEMIEDQGPEQPDEEPIEGQISNDRRRALKKLGIYGLYTAPALLATLTANKAVAVSGIQSGFSSLQGPVLL